jgi:hypothetical protein
LREKQRAERLATQTGGFGPLGLGGPLSGGLGAEEEAGYEGEVEEDGNWR